MAARHTICLFAKDRVCRMPLHDFRCLFDENMHAKNCLVIFGIVFLFVFPISVITIAAYTSLSDN